jgi:hypothetical protein
MSIIWFPIRGNDHMVFLPASIQTVWLAVAHLVLACVIWIGLVLSVVLGTTVVEQLRKQHRFDPFLVELGVSIIGSCGAVCFLLWLVTNGYTPLIPSLILAIAGVAVFFRIGARRERIGATELAFSLGTLVIGCVFVRGATDLTSKISQMVDSIAMEYRALVRGAIWLGVCGISVVMFKLYQRDVRRRHSEHLTRMQDDATYRGRYEEKCRLEGQLKSFYVREEWYEREHLKL